MPRINLLPWREELRNERQKNFAISAVVAVLLAGAVTWNVNFFMQSRVDYQNERNQTLEAEISRLDALIEEIAGLERQKDRLLARMEIIEELQRSRPDSVHLFEDLVRILPEGIFYTNVTQVDKRIEVSGVAESNARVSALMKNVEKTEWLEEPGLKVIEAVTRNQTRRSQFTVSAKQASETAGEEEL
jgi:type IV pilus assembly protein PilN